MNHKLSIERRAQIIGGLIEGNSVLATCRMTGAAKGTVLRLLEEVGQACAAYQDRTLRNLPCRHIQCDEIWSFCRAKEKKVPEEMRGVLGFVDVWTWTALDADTKLVPSWLVGDAQTAYQFIHDLAGRLSHRIQLTTDGNRPYVNAIEQVFGADIDYAMLVKLYGPEQEEVRYSPAKCLGTETAVIQGSPDPDHISTSYVERQNLTMRMSMRRFTRLTNAFSKKIENLEAAVALHFMYYNFGRVHKAIKTTPAIAAGVTNEVWTVRDIVELANSN